MKTSTFFAKVIEICVRKLEGIRRVDHQLCLRVKLLSVDEAFIRDSSNVFKSIVGIDASQLYPYSMCQDMPTGLYTRCEFDSDMQKFKASHNRTRNFENMVMSYYQETRQECRIESFHTSGNRKKLTVSM